MSASYDETLGTDLDYVRFRLGDISVDPESAALYSDEAILAALARTTTRDAAISELAAGLIARFAHMPTKWTQPGQSFDFSERIPAWRSLIAPIVTTTAESAWSMVDATFSSGTDADEYAR